MRRYRKNGVMTAISLSSDIESIISAMPCIQANSPSDDEIMKAVDDIISKVDDHLKYFADNFTLDIDEVLN
jgi:hypothetical protein